MLTVAIGGYVVLAFRCTPPPDDPEASVPAVHAHQPGERCWFCEVCRKIRGAVTKAQIEQWSKETQHRQCAVRVPIVAPRP